MTIGEKIKQRRIELNLTQEELAKKCGYKSRSSINKIELARDLPLNKIKQMAKALDLSVSYLMNWEQEKIVASLSTNQEERVLKYAALLANLSDEQRNYVEQYIEFITNKEKS